MVRGENGDTGLGRALGMPIAGRTRRGALLADARLPGPIGGSRRTDFAVVKIGRIEVVLARNTDEREQVIALSIGQGRLDPPGLAMSAMGQIDSGRMGSPSVAG